MNDVQRIKINFLSEMKEWFSLSWNKNFEFKSNKEVFEKLKFDKMRELYYMEKEIGKEEFALFQEEVVSSLDNLRNALIYKNITYYTVRFMEKKKFKALGIEVCCIKNELGLYDVYERYTRRDRFNQNTKYVMDDYFYKKYMAKLNSDEYKAMIKKSEVV